MSVLLISVKCLDCSNIQINFCRFVFITDEDEPEEITEEWTPLQRFLVANNLSSIHPVLEAEQIDLDALMLLTESDILALKLSLGPRRKLINAIAIRRRALENPSEVIEDSRL